MNSVWKNLHNFHFLLLALIFSPNTPCAQAQNLPPDRNNEPPAHQVSGAMPPDRNNEPPAHQVSGAMPPDPQFNQDEEDSPLLPQLDRNRNFSPVRGFDRGIPEKRLRRMPNAQEQDCRKLHAFLKNTVKLEKKRKTTSENVKNRLTNFTRTVASLPKAYCTLPQQDAFDISDMIAKNLLKDAGRKLHSLICGLNLEEIDSCCKSQSSGMQTLDRLAEQEKTSPTDISNIQQRWPNLIQIAIKSGNPDKILPPRNYMESLPPETRLREQVKIYKQAISSGKISQNYPVVVPQNYQASPGSARSSSTETDRELAMELFYKAMQYYAKGDFEKTRNALNKAHKLDPDNQEVSKALERIEKDIAMQNK